MYYFNKSEMLITPYDYIQQFLHIFQYYIAFVNFIELVCPKGQNRSVWTRDEFKQNERDLHSLYNQLLALIKQRNNREFRKFIRINITTYEHLLRLVKKKLQRFSMRKPIPAECRLLITLMYLAFDSPRPLLSMAFRLGLSTLRSIIVETCECIVEDLSPTYLKNLTVDDYYNLSEEYLEATGLPNCVGPMDGLEFPGEKKNSEPMIMVASCNTKYQITNLTVDVPYDIKDKEGSFIHSLLQDQITVLPDGMQMPDSGMMIPSYFVTPRTFPLIKHTMRPYPGKMLSPDKSSFNETLKMCTNYIDNSFGILLYRWRVLQNKFTCKPPVASNIIKSCVILHNFAIEHDRSYIHEQLFDNVDELTQEFRPGVWRHSIELPKSKVFDQLSAKNEAFTSRDALKDYLYNERCK